MSADGRASAVVVGSTIGTANASVLPDPVGDLASTSRPARASGRTSAWIRNGSWMERAASASTIGGGTPSSREDCCISFFRLLLLVLDLPTPTHPKEERQD